MSDIVFHFVTVGQWMLSVALALAFWRLLKGPTIPDRVVAIDLTTGIVLGQLVLLTVRTGEDLYLDAAIVLAVVGFLATVAFARYLEREDETL